MESAFPSDFSKDKDGAESTQGGLILVKFLLRQPESRKFEGRLILKYSSAKGEQFEQSYLLEYDPTAEEFHSSETMVKASRAYYYTHCMRQLLDNMNGSETKLNDLNRQQYLKNLQLLMEASPEHKKKDIANVVKIVEEFKSPEVALHPAA